MYNRNLRFHFVGIGGSGMSGIAEVLLNLGFVVSGSDLVSSPQLTRLRELGAEVSIGHAAANVGPGVSLVVYSSAIKPDNPELVAAAERHVPCVPRAEVLAELMRLKFGIAVGGAHGKTSTTSLIGSVLSRGGEDPTVVVGGRLKGTASGARLGAGRFLVAEADESDRSFLLLRPVVVVVTNIDYEHVDAYGSFAHLVSAFRQFVDSVPFYGVSILCGEDEHLRGIAEFARRRVVTYGFSDHCDIVARDITVVGHTTRFRVLCRNQELGEFVIPLPGTHYCLNALAALAVGLELDISVDSINKGLREFSGVARRSEVLRRSEERTVVSDYGHHPTEIRATIRALRHGVAKGSRLHAVFQPHRFSRTEALFAEFSTAFDEADTVCVTDIYPAGEAPRPDVSAEKLVAAMGHHPSAVWMPTLQEAGSHIAKSSAPGDVILFIGAGSIGAYAEEFARAL